MPYYTAPKATILNCYLAAEEPEKLAILQSLLAEMNDEDAAKAARAVQLQTSTKAIADGLASLFSMAVGKQSRTA